MEDDKSIAAFLTEIDSTRVKPKNPKLENVRKDHQKVLEVVTAFGKKIGNLADKQRNEYMLAYENHMIDIQRELHQLREKAKEITNKKTMDDKIKSLIVEEEHFKTTALEYDTETNLLRKRLRRITDDLLTHEKERDWLLRKLRESKKKYSALKVKWEDIKANGGGGSMYNLSQDSMSLDSLYTLNISKNNNNSSQHQGSKKSLLANDKATDVQNSRINMLNNLFTENSVLSDASRYEAHQTNTAATPNDNTSSSNHNKKYVANLVQDKLKQESLRNFVDQCIKSCHKGIWVKSEKRAFPELLADCVRTIEDPQLLNDDTVRNKLSRELASSSELYWAIAELMLNSDISNVLQSSTQVYEEKWNNLEPIDDILYKKTDSDFNNIDFVGSDLHERHMDVDDNDDAAFNNNDDGYIMDNDNDNGCYNDINDDINYDNNQELLGYDVNKNNSDSSALTIADDLVQYLKNSKARNKSAANDNPTDNDDWW